MQQNIRLAVEADLEQFAEIVNHYIRETAINFHDRVQSDEDWEATWEVLHERYPWLVAEKDGVVNGIAYATPWKLRSAYDWTCEVSVYLRSGQERLGIGRALSTRLLELLKQQGYRAALAVIALPNEGSVAFHEQMGYEHIGTMKQIGYKKGEWHDVSYWQKDLVPVDGPPPPIIPVPELEV